MSPVKKAKSIFSKVIDKAMALDAMEIHAYVLYVEKGQIPIEKKKDYEREKINKINEFGRKFHDSYKDTIVEILRWYPYLYAEDKSVSANEIYHDDFVRSLVEKGNYNYKYARLIEMEASHSMNKIYDNYVVSILRTDKEPLKATLYDGVNFTNKEEWIYKGYIYEVKGHYLDDQIKLLILEDFDKERRYFEKLQTKFNEPENTTSFYKRPRIPESVRIEVWRRDGGKCARCGSREKLEYDHIVPISKGGSNTARNIELLCENHNRSKSNNVV